MLLLPPTPDKPLCLACSPDSARLYIGCRDGRVLCWDRHGDALDEVSRHPGRVPVVRLVSGPDGVLAAACSREILLLYPDTGEEEAIAVLGLGSGLVAFGPGQHLAYTAHGAGWLRFYHVGVGPGRHVVRCSGDPLALAADPDHPWLVLGHGRADAGGATWWRLDAIGPDPAGSFQVNAPVVAVAVSPRGDRLALGTRAGMVSLIDPAGTGPTRVLGSFRVAQQARATSWEDGVFGLAFAPDGRELLTVSSDGDAQRWDVEGQRLVNSLHWQLGRLTALAFAPDGQTAAAIAASEQVVVWDVD